MWKNPLNFNLTATPSASLSVAWKINKGAPNNCNRLIGQDTFLPVIWYWGCPQIVLSPWKGTARQKWLRNTAPESAKAHSTSIILFCVPTATFYVMERTFKAHTQRHTTIPKTSFNSHMIPWARSFQPR